MNKKGMPAGGGKIAINAADLDHQRIDGTRIYIKNCLDRFGLFEEKDRFSIYHRAEFNPQLAFRKFANYEIVKLEFPFWWTQLRFAWEIFRTKPAVLWMPMHSLPYLRSKKTKTVVTIHDLAFKFFPEHYPAGHVRRLNMFTDYAARRADRLIAVSNSTKKDLLKFYPGIDEKKIKVIYHGFDRDLFRGDIPAERIAEARAKYKIGDARYLIYVGAIQPRKNLGVLLDAFESLRKSPRHAELALVIAGDLGWLYGDIVERIKKTDNVIVTGKFETADLPPLLAGARAFVFPSLYEGFGIPLIEAMACGAPVVAADNSSLTEITGDAGILFDARKPEELTDALKKVLENDKLRDDLRDKGLSRAAYFSWDKCAKETLEWLKG